MVSSVPSAAIATFSDDGILVTVQPSVYTLEVIMRTAHRFTARCFVHLSRTEDAVEVRFQPRGGMDGANLALEFCNDLLDDALRDIVAQESRAERDLILAHALSRHPVLNREYESAQAFSDPVGLLNPDTRCVA